MKCIYCKENKDSNQFNIEHVIPKAFTSFFQKNKTLKNCVCKDCNDYFGKYLDLILSRDSVLGILFRSITGIINPAEFEKTIKYRRVRLEAFCLDPRHGKLLVDIDFHNNYCRISNQIAVMNSTKGKRVQFRSTQFPHRKNLEAMGLKPSLGYIQFFGDANEFPDLEKKLEESGIQLSCNKSNKNLLQQKNVPTDKDMPLYLESIIDTEIKRALAKIIFNYFCYQYGAELILNSCFDDIRNFIRFGQGQITLSILKNEPLNINIQQIQKEKYSNIKLTVYQENNNIIGEISLFNNIEARVILSNSYPTLIQNCDSCYDVLERKIEDKFY